ncbi:MAG: hypothetical protein ABI318_03605 [Chthoniobacteraceae bacterium]
MFSTPKVIRCRNCKRLFSNFADECPECHTRTTRGWIGIVVPAVCVVVAIIALAWTIHMLANRPAIP